MQSLAISFFRFCFLFFEELNFILISRFLLSFAFIKFKTATMKLMPLLISLLCISQYVSAQKQPVNDFASIDKKALQLPDSLTTTTSDIAGYITANFKSDKDKIRAIFIWVASNIQYDIDNMFAINFYESREEKIAKPLQTKKGICENYAVLFNDICLKAGIKSYVVEGYTKQNGLTDNIPHAWCAALNDSTWYMFDPTWGSGYVQNKKFYRKINNDYFKVNPSNMIKSHMPFDYLWQFLNYPVTYQEFYDGKTQQNKAKPFYSYVDSIRFYENQNHLDQLIASSGRIEKNGVKNSLIYDRLKHIKLEIEYEKNEIENKKIVLENERQATIVNLYNSAVIDYNSGINDFDKFIDYRNKQFTPTKSDIEIQNMIDVAENALTKAKSKLNEIVNPDNTMSTIIIQLTKSIEEAEVQVKEQQNWLKIYFSKGKSGRKSMFTKYTWFGIPLN